IFKKSAFIHFCHRPYLFFLQIKLNLFLQINSKANSMSKYLIAGLGNIGPEYELTRHNIGFLTLDRLAEQEGLTFGHDRHAFVAEYKFKGRAITLIKPTTY